MFCLDVDVDVELYTRIRCRIDFVFIFIYYLIIKRICSCYPASHQASHQVIIMSKEQEERKTDFQSVVEFNETFGVPVYKEPQHDIFKENPALVEYRLSLIREEVKELEEAVKNHDLVETVDALADIIYVVQGMGASLGLDLDKAFDIVHKSNMSKVCKTEEEAKKTVQHYVDNMEKLGYDSPAYRKSADGKSFVVYNKNTSKVLKSINYTPAKFDWCGTKPL